MLTDERKLRLFSIAKTTNSTASQTTYFKELKDEYLKRNKNSNIQILHWIITEFMTTENLIKMKYTERISSINKNSNQCWII